MLILLFVSVIVSWSFCSFFRSHFGHFGSGRALSCFGSMCLISVCHSGHFRSFIILHPFVGICILFGHLKSNSDNFYSLFAVFIVVPFWSFCIFVVFSACRNHGLPHGLLNNTFKFGVFSLISIIRLFCICFPSVYSLKTTS